MKFLKAISRDGGGDTNIEIPYSETENGGSQTLQVAENVPVTSDEILASFLGGSPSVAGVQLVAAPGAGKVLVPVFATIVYRFGTVPYSLSGNDPRWDIGTGNPDSSGVMAAFQSHPASWLADGSLLVTVGYYVQTLA
jgi:hypothetical protein